MRDYLDTRPFRIRNSRSFGSLIRRPFGVITMIIILLVALFVLDRNGLLNSVRSPVEQGLSTVASPLSSMRDQSTSWWDSVTHIPTLSEENAALRRQVAALQERLIAQEQALAENAMLKRQLAIESGYPWKLQGADVVLRAPDAGRRTITVARGSADNIQTGMAVIGQTNNGAAGLIGVVEETHEHTARIVLLTDIACRLSVRVVHQSNSFLGMVQGQWQYGGGLVVRDLERDSQLEGGNVVVSAGVSESIDAPLPLSAVPPGVPIGLIGNITVEGSTTTAEVQPFVALDQVRYVWIILSHRR